MLTFLSTLLPSYKDQFKQLVKTLYQLEEVKFDADIARALKIDKSNITQILNGKREISEKMIKRLKAAYPVLNDHEVDTNVKSGEYDESHKNNSGRVALLAIERGGQRRRDLPSHHFIPFVMTNHLPYASGEARRRYDLDALKKAEIIEFYYSAPDFSECEIAVSIEGDAMARRYYDGDRLFLELRPDMQEIILGEPHMIITKTMKICRYVFPSDKEGYWLLKPENDWYPNQLIEIKTVGAIFQVKGRIG